MAAEPWKHGPIDTFFLFGTGICEGSWDPVREAILDVDPRAPVHVASRHEVAAANEAANFWFADLVHKRRRMHAILARTPEDLERHSNLRGAAQIEQFRAKVRAKCEEFAELDNALKESIVNRLKKAVASGSLRVRPQFREIMRDERFRGSAWYATTNWDMAVETFFERDVGFPLNRVDHIHGSTGRPERILLPSEVVEEPYRSAEQREVLIHSILPYVPLNWSRQICF